MKKKTAAALKKLVGLKRQRAEQDMAAAQMALERAQTDLTAMRAALQAPTEVMDFASISLAERNGSSRRLVEQLRKQEALVAERRTSLAEATDRLRLAFGSQQVLEKSLRQGS
ncbi:hypothetical protein D1224_05345 [Henriciella barbarensis]|uniref:Flagellar FliJ protein n=1 Tax=Henriciella barbarensis TaxID=86342 RepID=A0A399R1F0_9PROT|nr:hypothetical protein [Henriciella barbarensis]RIJ23687.1 hypothetical protein D1224_05345 [Henriciella barbarensis]